MSWADVHESKRGAAQLLRDAAAKLEQPGAVISVMDEVLAELGAARLALTGCRAWTELISAAESRRRDIRTVVAGGSEK